MIHKIQRLECTTTYLDDLNLDMIDYIESQKFVLIDTKMPIRIDTKDGNKLRNPHIAYRLLHLSYARGYRPTIWSPYTSRYRTEFGNKRYLVVRPEHVIEVQNKIHKETYYHVRWFSLFPKSAMDEILGKSKVLHDF